MKRAYFSEGCFAGKAWGKTTFLARRAEAEAANASVRSVLIIDPPDSFRDVAPLAGWPIWRGWRDFQWATAETGRVPRVNVFCFGYEFEKLPAYDPIFDFAVELGDTVLIVDEVQLFAPKAGKVNPKLERIAALGRHLPCSDGSERQTCLIVASQTWSGVGLSIRNQVGTVVAGRMRGSANESMLAAEVAADAPRRLASLKPHEWTVLAPDGGKLPPLAPLDWLK